MCERAGDVCRECVQGVCAGGAVNKFSWDYYFFFSFQGTAECPKMAIASLSGESLMTPLIGEQSKAFAKTYFLDEPLAD